MENFPRYAEYKDSGVQWIGKVPKQWLVIELGRIGQFSASGIDKISVKGQESVRMVNYTDVYGNLKFELWKDSEFMETTAPEKKALEHELHKGDILFTPSSETINEIGLSSVVMENMPGVVFSYHLVRFKSLISINLRFKKYLCNYPGVYHQFSSMCKGTTRKILIQENFKKIKVVLPSIAEQQHIADFLDQKTAEINEAIAKKQRLIELLEERKTILINQAVTKGLNPDVSMRDSAVEWIGEIPVHWDVIRLSWIFHEKDETGYPDLPLLVVSINTGITHRDMDDENHQQIASDFNTYKRALQGDISFNKMRMWQGAVGVVPEDGLVSSDYVVARPAAELNSNYFEYLFRTEAYKSEFLRNSHGIVMDRNRLYWEDFKAIYTHYPPVDEQNEITEYITELDLQITSVIVSILSEIEKLSEYKIILISKAVTGKIKV